ncbi:armadillo repeat-containing protein gudu, partial [Ctenocephalides felis]|uniref:armadillo repeat-containing protein gudu n=1 Tax=Ctenocephalides felis TaxID=7515 RepID=UPI000E6E15F7
LAKLIKCVHLDVVKSSMGTLQGCASEHSYQLAIRTEGMVPDIVKYLSSDDRELQMHCASCLFKCSEDKETRILIRRAGGLEPLVAIIKDRKLRDDKPLIAAASGAIWKCAANDDNINKLDQLGTVSALTALLTEENEDVLTNVTGALSEMLRFKHNVDNLRQERGIPHLVNLLKSIHNPLLENVPLALAQCAKEPDAMAIIEEMDGVRLIWSILKNVDVKVKANAAWALRPCIENATDSGEMVRSFVGALELAVSLLDSKDTRVLAGICAAIAIIATDVENLAVMTDHGVVGKLARLVGTTDEGLREYLADAIANCCGWSNNRILFGKLGAITPLVAYMAAADQPRVHKTTALALCRLSEDPFNCITMHQSGVVPFLLETVSSEDTALQDASAGCLCNIRRLALAAEKFKLRL